MWNGTMFVDLDWPLNASSLLSASAELLVGDSRWNFVTALRLKETRMMGLYETEIKTLIQVCLFDTIRQCDRRAPRTATSRQLVSRFAQLRAVKTENKTRTKKEQNTGVDKQLGLNPPTPNISNNTEFAFDCDNTYAEGVFRRSATPLLLAVVH